MKKEKTMGIYKIAENGESCYSIVANQYADEAVRYAASELQKYLLKSTGAVVNYFSDRCPSVGPEIRIGPAVRGGEETADDLAEEGFRILGRGENILILGHTPRGVIYGVYYFLEKFCGFTCFTREVEVIDRHPVLEITLDEIAVEPSFEFRDTYFRFAFDGDFCAKNRSNTSLGDLSHAKGGRMKWYNFHHSYNDLVPESRYFDEHPEYYSEVGGVRARDSQLCLTNPEVARIAEATLRRWIRENPECRVFSVAQNDNNRRCTCRECLALEEKEGSPAGPVIHFVNRLADAIRDDHPEILLHTFAYQYSLPAPREVVARENVIVRLCTITCQFHRPLRELAATRGGQEGIFVRALDEWQSHASRLYVWDYAVNFRNYLQPFVHLHALRENLRYFKEVGVRGILEEGNFAYGGGGALDDLKSYVTSRLLFDIDTDVDLEIHRFCQAVYGAAAGERMEAYVRLMMEACESAPLGLYMNPDAEYLTDDLLADAEQLFLEAVHLAENETYKKRIEREYLSLRFVKLARTPLDAVGRDAAIDAFFEDVKSHGITEIRERRSLAFSRGIMKRSLYVTENGGHVLYYIMK